MSTTLQRPVRPYSGTGEEAVLDAGATRDPRYQAYLTMRIGYTVLPLAMGIDKFFDAMTSWPKYLADWIDNIVPGTAQSFMYGVGVIEIAAALLMLARPRYGAYLGGLWLAGIIVNLLSYGEWYDIAVRDFGLMLGAFALARLARVYDRGW